MYSFMFNVFGTQQFNNTPPNPEFINYFPFDHLTGINSGNGSNVRFSTKLVSI